MTLSPPQSPASAEIELRLTKEEISLVREALSLLKCILSRHDADELVSVQALLDRLERFHAAR